MGRLYGTTRQTILELPTHEAMARVHLTALGAQTQRPAFSDFTMDESQSSVTPRADSSNGQKLLVKQPIVKAQMKAVAQPQAPSQHLVPNGSADAAEKWEENDYIVNVRYER